SVAEQLPQGRLIDSPRGRQHDDLRTWGPWSPRRSRLSRPSDMHRLRFSVHQGPGSTAAEALPGRADDAASRKVDLATTLTVARNVRHLFVLSYEGGRKLHASAWG